MSKTIGAILNKEERLGVVVFDVITNRETLRSRQLTSHVVESGSKISDNVIDNNVIINFSAEIGNVDLYQEYSVTERAAKAYIDLKKMYEQKTLIDYQTGFELFENMIITSISDFESAGTPSKPEALIVDIVLEQVNFVQTEQVLIPQSILKPGKTQKQLASTVNRGRQNLIPLLGDMVLNLISTH
jgi:hypothetical protein